MIRPNQTNSLDYVWTISPTMVNEVLATVSLDDVYIPVDEAHFLDRTTVGINYPYIFPEQAHPDAHSDGQYHELQRVEWRAVPVALVRSDLHAVRQLDLDQRGAHV